MSYDIKQKALKKEEKMNLRAIKKNNAIRQNPDAYSRPLTFFPLSEESGHLCQNISKSLLHLEKDLARFNFALKEIKDIFSPP